MEIRKAKDGDAVVISSLMSELGYQLDPEDVRLRVEVYLSPPDTVLVAEDDGEVVGFVSFHVIPFFHAVGRMGRITAMSVSSKRKREGIGRALLEELDRIAVQEGCCRIEVTSGDHRENEAHLFYQACGYSLESRRFRKCL